MRIQGQDLKQKQNTDLSGWAKDSPAGAVQEGHMRPVDVRQAGVVARMRHTTLELARLHARQCVQAQMLESELKLG